MARPLEVIVEELLDYITQARTYAADLTFEQYFADQKTQRAVERCIAAIGNVFRHEYHNIAARIVWDTVRLHLAPLEAVVRTMQDELRMNDGGVN
jgi:uncharacterized protein with HEPN domain